MGAYTGSVRGINSVRYEGVRALIAPRLLPFSAPVYAALRSVVKKIITILKWL